MACGRSNFIPGSYHQRVNTALLKEIALVRNYAIADNGTKVVSTPDVKTKLSESGDVREF